LQKLNTSIFDALNVQFFIKIYYLECVWIESLGGEERGEFNFHL